MNLKDNWSCRIWTGSVVSWGVSTRRKRYSYRGKGEWKEEYGDLNILDPVLVLIIPTHHCQNLDISALKHAYTRVLDGVRIQQLDTC
jgi:hypothetical protein